MSFRRFPWYEESFATGNYAIISIREKLMSGLNTNGHVHTETMLFTIGALAGCAAQNAVWKERKAQGLGLDPTGSALNRVMLESGASYYAGDLIDAYLMKVETLERPLPLWSQISNTAVKFGLAPAELPDIDDLFRHCRHTVGTPDWAVPRVTPEHLPQLRLQGCLALFWVWTRDTLRLPMPEKLSGNDKPVRDTLWPALLGVVASQYIEKTRGVIDLRTAVVLVMEAAICASMLDPRSTARLAQVLKPIRYDVSLYD